MGALHQQVHLANKEALCQQGQGRHADNTLPLACTPPHHLHLYWKQ